MTVRVLALTRYPRLGASSRLRFLQFVPPLEALGVQVEIEPFFDDHHLRYRYAGDRRFVLGLARSYLRRLRRLSDLRSFDVIWLEKELYPWLPSVFELPALGRLPYVVDFDEALHLRYSENSNPLLRLALTGKLERIVSRAAGVIVGNSNLEDWAKQAGAAEVVRIPTVVDLEKYPATPLPETDPFTIGWIGSNYTVEYLQRFGDVLARICQQQDVRLLVIGPDRLEMPGAGVEIVPWSEASEAELLRRVHVGINCLPDGPWEQNKSAFKVIQYMASARPALSSPVGACNDVIEDGVNGFLVNGDGAWAEAVERLRNDRDLASRLGKAGRSLVEKSYSLAAHIPRVADILENAARRSPPR